MSLSNGTCGMKKKKSDLNFKRERECVKKERKCKVGIDLGVYVPVVFCCPFFFLSPFQKVNCGV